MCIGSQIMNLKDFFAKYPIVAVAFSGGVDSSYLLYAAKKYAKKVCAYYVKSDFQPQFELDDAIKLTKETDAEMKIINLDVLSVPCVKENPENRCYYCKKAIFSAIINEAEKDGYKVLIDGTNASDDENDRPGVKALRELKVLSPLKECGLTKEDIRKASNEAGLFTWNKPAYACLATRIATAEQITEAKLNATEKCEEFLSSLGFTDFRIRLKNGIGKIQVKEAQMPLIIKNRKSIFEFLKKYYDSVVLDLEVR